MSLNGHISGSVGKKGNELGQFDTPEGIVASYITGRIYVADCRNHHIQVLGSDLSFILNHLAVKDQRGSVQ